MTTSPRRSRPEPLIIPTVIAAKGVTWNAATAEVAATDAQRLLEALVAEVGVEGTVTALRNHGFDPTSYGYLLSPLHQEAADRRKRANSGNLPQQV
jgi:hypothetical protein